MAAVRPQQPVNPLGPVLFAVIAVAVVGLIYLIFGVGKDTVVYAVALLAVVSIPVVLIFGVAGIVLGVRRLLRGLR